MADDFQADIDAVSRIPAVPTILEVICRTTGMGFAAIARVTDDRWIACGVRDEIDFGLQPGGELKIETTICSHIRASQKAVVINHVAEDETYREHHTPLIYGFQSYISMPIVLSDGSFFGTLCAIDPRPARVNTPETIGMFKLFAELIAFHIDASERVIATEASLLGERRTAELREQFIAVLGHDLRNPLASIGAGVRMLQRTPLDSKASNIVGLIQSSVTRMSGLIDNVLDFARGRLGGGLTLDRDASEPLEPILTQVIAELRLSWPDRVIETHFKMPKPVNCDRTRVAQLLSNLLGNALTYGAPDRPILVRAVTDETKFELAVSNAGSPIPEAAMARLFLPFSRGDTRPIPQQGLGLGLYIASEVARAHGGTLGATSSPEETCFTFRMPLTC
jgi:signal transduction histidine kinase